MWNGKRNDICECSERGNMSVANAVSKRVRNE